MMGPALQDSTTVLQTNDVLWLPRDPCHLLLRASCSRASSPSLPGSAWIDGGCTVSLFWDFLWIEESACRRLSGATTH